MVQVVCPAFECLDRHLRWDAPAWQHAVAPRRRGTLMRMTAKEKLLAQAPSWTEAEATAALRVVETHAKLAAYLDEEAQLSAEDLDARENGWAEQNAREAIREEPW